MVENLMQIVVLGVDIEQLEAEFESMNDKWVDFKKKVSKSFYFVIIKYF